MEPTYIVVTCKAGEREAAEPVGELYASVEDAAEAIGGSLEVHGLPEHEAARLARFAAGCQVGSIVSHRKLPDLLYRILEADFTSNGRPITPGLRVEDYDRRTGVVESAQFMDDGMMTPGGRYFREHPWYYVLRDGEDRSHRQFDGSRMRAL